MKRVRPESEERPCRAKEPRRQAGIRAKQGRSELAERVGFEPTVPCGTTDFEFYGAKIL